MSAYTKLVEEAGTLTGLAAYNAARPQHSEGLAIFIASYLAHETECANINLLHLSSRKAFEAALMMQEVFPHINFRREVTVGHLLLDIRCAGCCLRQGQSSHPSPRRRGVSLGEGIGWESGLDR